MNKRQSPTLFFCIVAVFFSAFAFLNLIMSEKNIKENNILSSDSLIGIKNFFLYRYHQTSGFPESVIIGKDGFFFLGDSYAEVIKNTVSKESSKEQERIEKFLMSVEEIQKTTQNKQSAFIFVVAPNKHSIYPEFLPNWADAQEESRTDYISREADSKNIHFLDLRKALIDAKETGSFLYRKKDTHWNLLGASIAYNEIIDHLNQKNNLVIVKADKSILPLNKGNVGGDLTRFLKLKNEFLMGEEIVYEYDEDDMNEICIQELAMDLTIEAKCHIRKQARVVINKAPYYISNPNSRNAHRLLWICDSFGTEASQLYHETFSEIIKVHYSHLTGEKIKEVLLDFQPDVVIYQQVERAISHTIL